MSSESLLDKQLAAQQYILKKEGFIKKSKFDGVHNGKRLYSIGYGTRGKLGQTISYEDAGETMNQYLISEVFPKLDKSLPKNKYIAYASYAYNTGKIPKRCDDILNERYQYSNGRKLKGLVKRRREEYNMCVGE